LKKGKSFRSSLFPTVLSFFDLHRLTTLIMDTIGKVDGPVKGTPVKEGKETTESKSKRMVWQRAVVALRILTVLCALVACAFSARLTDLYNSRGTPGDWNSRVSDQTARITAVRYNIRHPTASYMLSH
jgi:hypothetical protein